MSTVRFSVWERAAKVGRKSSADGTWWLVGSGVCDGVVEDGVVDDAVVVDAVVDTSGASCKSKGFCVIMEGIVSSSCF